MAILEKRKLIEGIGINDVDEPVNIIVNKKTVRDPFHNKWKSMLVRCYNKKYQERQLTYIGCTVCDDWLYFSNFKKWMKEQDWENKQLDKDILVPGNKVYSPDNCMFISKKLNSFLTDRKAARGKWPQGVVLHNKVKLFHARIRIDGKLKCLGFHKTQEQAAALYNLAKSNHIREIVATEKEVIFNDKLKLALLRHADRFFSLHLEYKGL